MTQIYEDMYQNIKNMNLDECSKWWSENYGYDMKVEEPEISVDEFLSETEMIDQQTADLAVDTHMVMVCIWVSICSFFL